MKHDWGPGTREQRRSGFPVACVKCGVEWDSTWVRDNAADDCPGRRREEPTPTAAAGADPKSPPLQQEDS